MEISLRKSALIAGAGYIIIFVLGLITNFAIFEKLIIPGDAETTIIILLRIRPCFVLVLAVGFLYLFVIRS